MDMDINYIINYRNKAVSVIIILLAFIVGYNIYKQQADVIESLKQAKETEVKKLTTLGGIDELEKRVKLYRDFVNRKDPLSLIKAFNKIAREVGVNIASLKPEQSQDFPMYLKYPYSLTVTAKSFSLLGKFISRLESSPDIFIIDSAVIRTIGTVAENSTTDSLSLSLVVNTVIFK
jgi:Tfp pilus assembly protein PilO